MSEEKKKAMPDLSDLAASERADAIYRVYQQNIRVTESLSDEILLGLREGQPVTGLFLKAIDAISRMTNNAALNELAERYILTVYGDALGEKEAVEQQIASLKARIEKLEHAGVEDEADLRTAVALALKAHRAKLAALEEQLKEGEK